MDLSIFLPSLSTNDNSSSSDSSDVGPLIFNPIASSLTLFFSSPSFVPSTLSPNFITSSLSRFLTTILDHNASTSLLPSSVSSVSAVFGPQISPHANAAANFRHNGLQFLHCPGTTSVIVFFPTGDNSDGVGFLVLYVNNQDSKLNAMGGISTTLSFNNHHRINNIAVVSLDPPSTNAAQPVGYLMVSTCYAVHWFVVEVVRGKASSDPVNPRLDFIGSTSFKKSPVVDACWNPHLPREESLVLLERGELFLCHLNSFGIRRETLKVSFDTCLGNGGGGGWLACVFSWHPRVIVVAHSNCVFLVDLRESEASSSILVKTSTYATNSRDGQFIALCGVGSEGLCFVVTSTKRVILCDVRRPLMPLLQWDL